MEALRDIVVVIAGLLVLGWLIKGVSLWLTPKRKTRSRDDQE